MSHEQFCNVLLCELTSMPAKRLKDYPSVSLTIAKLSGYADFGNIFGRDAPVHIDIGTGKATFLLSQSLKQPEVNFLGIERASRYYRHAVDRMGRWGVENVRIIRAEVAAFISGYVKDNSVDCFHIYFPDPWPKTKHHKRRLLTRVNIEQMLRCLKSAGTIRIATDHHEYYQQIEQVLGSLANRLEQIPFSPTASAVSSEVVGTNYERKYIRDKKGIFTIAVRKTG